jgi:hypothetical protein
LKKIIWGICKFFILSVIILSSGLAIVMHYKVSFDPVKEIITLKNEKRRDDALDFTRFCINNKSSNKDTFKKIEEDLKYTLPEKVGAFSEGAILGKVYDMYSGIGAVASDLCVYGDVRDIGIQAYYYFKGNPDFNRVVTILSSIGIILSAKPVLHGIDSYVKNSQKYVRRFSGLADKGILRKLFSRKIPLKDSEKVWTLFKKNDFSIPRTVSILANTNNIKELDTAISIIKHHKITGNAFLYLNGSKGLKLYASLPTDSLRRQFIKAFKKNPRAVIGLTKSQFLIHAIKIFEKYGLNALIVPVSMFALFLAMLPPVIVWVIFIATSSYFIISSIWIPIRTLKKERTKS